MPFRHRALWCAWVHRVCTRRDEQGQLPPKKTEVWSLWGSPCRRRRAAEYVLARKTEPFHARVRNLKSKKSRRKIPARSWVSCGGVSTVLLGILYEKPK